MSAQADVTATIAALAEQLRAQAALYRRILELSERQRDALRARALNDFHALLPDKARLMGELTDLEAAMAPNRMVWEAHRKGLAPEAGAGVRDAVQDVRASLEQLVAVEQECERELAAAKDEVQRDLSQLNQGRQALQSYKPAPNQPKSRFLDLGG